MKINSFFDKDSPDNSKRLRITAAGIQSITTNVSVERLGTEIENLKSKLSIAETNLETTTKTHLKEKESFTIAKKASKESNEQLVKITEQYNLLVLDVKTYQESITKQNAVVEGLKDRVRSLTPIENTYKEFQIKYFDNVGELEASTARVTVLHGVKDALEEKVHELSGYKETAKKELEHVKTKYNSMSDVFSTLEQNNLNLKEDLGEVNRELQSWKNDFSSLKQENHNLVSIKTNLTKWLDDIQSETASLATKETLQERELQKARTTLKTQLLLALTTGSFTEIGEVLGNLLDSNTYLRIINRKQLVELAKPSYTSQSAIERSEGFKLPRNLIAPKNSLGTSKPTLLKVRT
tara:strand:- start:711 stop:1766 length:1056 start_codon:yes stop_codon:yes gene_type:complete